MAEALDLKVFENLTPREIAAALSVFCSIRLSDQDKVFNVEYAIQNSKIILTSIYQGKNKGTFDQNH